MDYFKEYCIGCGLCSAVKGQDFITDDKGFKRPDVKNLKDGVLDLFEQVCPVHNNSLKKLEIGNIWGKREEVYLSYSRDSEIRHKASSGGVLTSLALYLLESGKVDSIIHTCVSEENPIETKTCISNTREEVLARCGSRYSISSPFFDCLNRLEENKKYAFIGKPCDVTALQNYFDINEEIKNKIPYTLSFFCAGIPSKVANESLLHQLGCHTECRYLNYRGNGWPGYTVAVNQEGKEHAMDYVTAWGKILGRDVHKFCRFCMDGIGERADISCGDAWFLTEELSPDFSEHEGRNVVFARSIKGRELFERAMLEGYLYAEKFTDFNALYRMQTYQFDRRTTMHVKVKAFDLLFKIRPSYSKAILKKYSKASSMKRKGRIFGGTVKRILMGRV
ncbi:Coenzyme F420 hydrogenase/dehydrogenase, beta subunit C-terminal domain [Clostridium sp. Marseille-P299]|uniref:Coenzyme F420 hydrogenase/dehydrogenase, beta subunit C-terminal domain n=1 Tax=Clostridium sp. Marseille-P299 TaxID=1805477 RepID=UPI001FA733DC|nr:Coenzyme F420 hydrogenase/dehydrogenase, beta subunit C-terminal domain [Clostridium sp. Marseille-P299]